MIRICTSMANAGYEVVLVGRKLATSKPLTAAPYTQHRLNLFFNCGKLFYIELNFRLFFKLLIEKYDIAYAVDLDTLFALKMAAFFRQKALIYDAHEYFTEVPELAERPVSKKIWEIMAGILIPRVKYAITVCSSLSEIFENKYGVKFEVIRNVPYLNVLTKGEENPTANFIVIYQGVLNDGRGLEESIMAMQQLTGVALWICGEGDLSASLRALSASCGVTETVKFLGKLTPTELKVITSQAHLGLNLLKNKGLNYYYSLANKAFDYMHAGIPSLNMAFPEYTKLNERYEVFELLDELEPSLIADAIMKLKDNKQLYQHLSSNAKKAAQELNWQLESKKLIDFINSVK